MELTPKITSFQFYTILFLSRVFSMVTYVASLRTHLSTTDEVIMTIVMAVFLLVTAIPTALLLKTDNKSSLIMRASCLSKVYAKIICVVYIIDYLYFGIITTVRFGIFTGSVMFPDTNILFFIFVMLAASAYIAIKGIEAIGRSAVIILVPVIFSLLFVFVSQADEFDILNFTSAFSDNTGDIISSGFYTCARTGELAFVTLLAPYVKNQKSSHLYSWIFAVSIIIFITEFMLSGVLGNFGGTQLFSMYSLSVLAEFGFIERMDALITCMWLLCAGVKISITLFLCETLFTSLFGKRKKLLYIAISAVVIFIGTIPLSDSLVLLANLIRSPIAAVFYLMTVVILPLSVYIGEKIKRRKADAKA